MGRLALREADVAALRHRHLTVRRQAAGRIARTWGSADVPRLLDAMAGDTPTRSRLLWIAGQLGEIGAPILLSALDDPVFWMRGRAAEHLGRLGISEAGELVSRLLRDPHPWTRGCAAAAVGRLKHVGALQALIPLLDEEAGVCAAAARALKQLGDPTAIPALARARLHGSARLTIVDALSGFDGPVVREAMRDELRKEGLTRPWCGWARRPRCVLRTKPRWRSCHHGLWREVRTRRDGVGTGRQTSAVPCRPRGTTRPPEKTCLTS